MKLLRPTWPTLALSLSLALSLPTTLAAPAQAPKTTQNTAPQASNKQAAGLMALQHFIAQAQGGSARFTQTVTPPSSVQGQTSAKPKVSQGHFAYARPQHFRLEYTRPYPQTIVADGQTLWFYDPDLEQVTASAQAPALAQTPMAILTSARSLTDLEREFHIRPYSAQLAATSQAALGQYLWVEVQPKIANQTLTLLRAGFSRNGQSVELRALDIYDSFGQRSLMEFGPNQGPAPASQFQFQPPAGTAVVRQ